MLKNNYPANILVVEDNAGDFALVENYLEHEVMPVIVQAKNFGQASSILLAGDVHFDVILLDLTLPDNGGEKLITDIISLSDGCPVIVLTGYTDVEFGIKSLSLGVADYLIKDEINSSSLYKSILYTVERKKATKELEQSEKRYSDLFQLSPQPMWVYDSVTLDFLDVNAAAINHYEYSREDFLAMNINKLIPDEDRTAECSCLHKKQDPLILQELCRHKKKNEEVIQVELQSNVIDFNGRDARITLANDITERVNYIGAIEKQNKILQEIAWIQSHVVRAPLAKIMGLIDLI
ncbi:MAG: response regulator, partial [Ginsengibacter sp.]